MAKDPAVLLYPADFLTGTMMMDYDTKGRYITLLCLQQQTGPIKEKNFKEICGEKFDEISEKFQRDSKGNYFNKRMKLEMDKRKKFTESRRSNGSKGGRPKKANEKQEKSYKKPLGLPSENLIENENEIYINNIILKIIYILNNACGTKYRATTKKTRTLIQARLNEGFTLEDFETVILKKSNEWVGTEYEKYLRPETLFGTKFEGYLNQKKSEGKEGKQYDFKPSRG